MIRNLQGGRFINNKEKYYFPSSGHYKIFCVNGKYGIQV